jgi:regulator of cell morphogenesis and NO signaling
MSETCCRGGQHGAGAAAGRTGQAFASEETVEAAAKRSPRGAAILRGLGIDTCCGGSLTLAQAAAAAGVSMETVRRALGEGAETS